MLPRDPVPVDAIPDLGENQQIVFTEWRIIKYLPDLHRGCRILLGALTCAGKA